jgi:undecaprenyl-diphosphatase
MPQLAMAPEPAQGRHHAVHLEPPTSPTQVFGWPSTRLYMVVAAFAVLAIAARADGGDLLLNLDQPIERLVVENRTSYLDTFFRSVSFLGSTVFVLLGGAALAAIAIRRCRIVAVLAIVATFTRPLVEFTLKEVVGRDRPSLGQMVNGEGHAFPSGHVMAGATLWMLVPTVVALYLPSRRLWWVVAGGSLGTVTLIGLSRVYLGVHWTTDVVGGLLVAATLLTVLDAGFRWLHDRHHCAQAPCT